MFTADDARRHTIENLDERLKFAVLRSRVAANAATIRIYVENGENFLIRAELERRGFKNISFPNKAGAVYFEWG